MLELNFDPFPNLETERLVLRRITMNDAAGLFSFRSSVEAMKYICKPLHASLDDSRAMISRIDDMIQANEGINWCITLKGDTQMIGTISYHRIEKGHYRAEIGYMLNPGYWRRGLISEAVKAVIDYGFTAMKLHSIEAQIDPRNKGSEEILKKFNFVKEAYYKENYFYDGQFLDTAVYSLLTTHH